MQLTQRIANLDAWFESIHTPDGYGGPVVHWWQNCLQYTGAGLDWRYEGMILGYLNLWERTRETAWLEKATRGGESLVKGQLPNGNFRHSSFELNPYGAGTPHEAAADIGLLNLAMALRKINDTRWQKFSATAEKNLTCFFIDHLWDAKKGRFRDSFHSDSFVPNKACTLAEALFDWAELQQDAEVIETFALPTLNAVRKLQLKKGRLKGAIPQSEQNGKVVAAYFPFYIARCIPAYLRAYTYTENRRWLEAAVDAFRFIEKFMGKDGLLPQVIYPRSVNAYPKWIAPLGDVLRVGDLLATHGVRINLFAMKEQFLGGQLPTGGLITGRGFGSQISQFVKQTPDFRDHMPVAGWSDKAFRFLTGCLPAHAIIPRPKLADWRATCHVRGKTAVWHETQREMKLTIGRRTLYQWQKGKPWAAVSAPEVLWK